ncbi:DUF4190 domain-containing protein [Aquibacillus rhizosphaerae]|uniref:DUF4190 domain-containing protein n=1 Tax=Aquibacillus rhizosphaerae TaxID=3051431 RepID=A0ABT7L5X7_9BACI|nr:DUF4190 domain-containing protein [Aquibacillus sp. LR5S19]MDL4839976.1 DUF4190 domain-containing protein [Aquibacillus sp. LR5S19]
MSNVDVSNDIDIKDNRKCIVSLVLGILSIITFIVAYLGVILSIIGLIYGFLGLKEVNRFKQNGKRKAVTGITCCFLGIFLAFMSNIIAVYAIFS